MILNFFKRLKMTTSTEDFTFGFDGDSLKEHKIDAIYLSIALAGLSDLLITVNNVLNDSSAELKIKVKPNFQAGSINILTELQQYVQGVIGYHPITTLLSLIGLGGGGYAWKNSAEIIEKTGKAISSTADAIIKVHNLIDLFRAKGDDRIDAQEEKQDTIILSMSSGKKIEVTKDLAKLFAKEEVRKAISVLLSPLEQDGIDEFYTLDKSQQKTQTIYKTEKDNFIYVARETDIRITNQVTEERTLFIKKPDFLKKSAWEFISDGRVIKATIEDKDFLNEVQNGLHLYAGCHFRCKILVSYELNDNNMPIDGKTKFTIVKVIDGVKEPLKQIDIFHEEK